MIDKSKLFLNSYKFSSKPLVNAKNNYSYSSHFLLVQRIDSLLIGHHYSTKVCRNGNKKTHRLKNYHYIAGGS